MNWNSKLATLVNHPTRTFRKYSRVIQCKLSGFPIPYLGHDYTKFFKVENADVVLDVGATFGLFTVEASKKASHVVAVEPEPHNLQILRNHIKNRKINNVTIIPKAVWKCKTKLPLYLSWDPLQHSLISNVKLSNKPSVTKKTIMVEADTIDNIIEDLGFSHVDFIKTDVEGAEIEALQGAEQTLKKTRTIVIASYHETNGEKTLPKVLRSLLKRNFETYVYDDLVHATVKTSQ